MATTFADIVNEVQSLDADAKRELMDLLSAWLVQERREEILRNAQQAKQEYSQGLAKRGGVNELMADLHAEG